MTEFSSAAAYEEQLAGRAELPKGFSAAAVGFDFFPKEKAADTPYRMNLSALTLDRPTSCFTAVFTRNKAPGAPVQIGRKLLSADTCRGVLINNKIANVCAPGGKEAAAAVTDAFSRAMGYAGTPGETEVVFPSSTGIIGWDLPVPEMQTAAKSLAEQLRRGTIEGGTPVRSMLPVAKAMMTTDAFPKIRSASCGGGRIVAAAKGAGMIEPNLATMLVFITTDIELDRTAAAKILARTAEGTFNCISIDSDQSTSDTVLLLSSCMCGGVDEQQFEEALHSVCSDLADDIVRNGEGTNHALRVLVAGGDTYEHARGFGKAVINSPLVKTAIFGNDPNVGRIVMALGDYAGNNDVDFDPRRLSISIGGIPVFQAGTFMLNEAVETDLHRYLLDRAFGEEHLGYPPHEKMVEISVDLDLGTARAAVVGSDLSYDYVKENADYRT